MIELNQSSVIWSSHRFTFRFFEQMLLTVRNLTLKRHMRLFPCLLDHCITSVGTVIVSGDEVLHRIFRHNLLDRRPEPPRRPFADDSSASPELALVGQFLGDSHLKFIDIVRTNTKTIARGPVPPSTHFPAGEDLHIVA
jgi:hypothetical protein